MVRRRKSRTQFPSYTLLSTTAVDRWKSLDTFHVSHAAHHALHRPPHRSCSQRGEYCSRNEISNVSYEICRVGEAPELFLHGLGENYSKSGQYYGFNVSRVTYLIEPVSEQVSRS